MSRDLIHEFGAKPAPPSANRPPPAGVDLLADQKPQSPTKSEASGRDILKEIGAPGPATRSTSSAPVQASVAAGEPTTDEMERATRPARAITTRGGQTLFVPESELQTRDNWDADTQGEQRAPWTGEGGVIESLPAQMVAGTRNAVANLRRVTAEESAAQRRPGLSGPALAETPEGALTGRVAAGSMARQADLLAKDEDAVSTATKDVERAMGDMAAVTPAKMNLAQQAVSSLAQSAPPTLIGIASGILTRNPALAMAIAGGGGAAAQAGSTYGEAREKGASHRLSSVAASVDAILEGVGEALPLKFALRPGVPVMRRILQTVAAESGQEAATEAGQALNAYLTYDPDITLKEAWHGIKVAALAGGMGGALYGGVGAAADASRGSPEPTGATPTVKGPIGTAASLLRPPEALGDVVQVPLTEAGANKRAEFLASLGQKARVIPHPAKSGRFTVVTDQRTDTAKTLSEGALAEDSDASGPLTPDPATSAMDSGAQPANTDPDANSAPRLTVSQIPAHAVVNINPSDAQKESGNYRKAHINMQGLAITIENPKGSERKGVGPEGERWSVQMPAAYGYIKRTTGADAEQIDVYIGDDVTTDQVFVIDQIDPDTRRFDEHKAMLSFPSEQAALNTYERGFSDGRGSQRAGAITSMPIAEFKEWLSGGNTTRPIAYRAPDRQVKASKGRDLFAELAVQRTARDESASTDNALPGTGIAMTPPYSAAGGTVEDTGRARPDAIRQAIRKLLNVPLNEGHFKHSRDTLGIYKVKPRTIRVKNQNDIGVIAHETGHHFSETSRPARKLMQAHDAELMKITPYAAKQKTSWLRREEGFAEYLRLLWTRPQDAQALAPGFHSAFRQYIDANGYRPAFDTIEGSIRDWENLPPTDRILAKVGRSAERASAQEILDGTIFQLLDRWLPLKRMVQDLKPDIAAGQDPFKAAHLLAGDAAIIEDWIVSHTIPFDPAQRADPANYGKSLRDIIKPVSGDIRSFSAYLIARRAGELMRQGKEHLFTREEIKAGIALETPEFKKAAESIYAYNDQLIDYAVDGGLLAPAIAEKLRQHTAYIPFFRESEDSYRGGGGKNPFKRIFGGTENLRDPIANLVQNTANIIYATNRNAVLVKAFKLAREIPGGGRWIESIPVPDTVLNIPKKTILDAFESQGVTLDTATVNALAQIQKLIVPNPTENTAERIVIARVNGETRALQINNKLLHKALQSFEHADMGIVETILSKPAEWLRAGVTLSPEFMARNFMRDTLSGFIQSKAGMPPLIGTIGGFKEVATRSEMSKLFRAFGGSYSDLWKGDSKQTAEVLERMAKRGKFDPRTILTPSGVIDVLRRLGSVSEAGTRIGEFKRTAQGSDVDSLIDAAYNAREVSVDFGMHGANPTVRLMTRITPFLNPAMQGFYKMARTSRERFMPTLLRGSVLTAFSVALFLMNRDQDWYDELENWEKNIYWHLDVGLRDDQGKVIPLRLPKPFEWGALFGSIPEALSGLAIDSKGPEFRKRLASVFKDAFGLRVVPTAVLVPAEQWKNESTFTGRRIVPESKEILDPELQYGPGTSLTARELGQATGTSPARIDHLVRGLLGTMGVYSVMLTDQALRAAGDYSEPPATGWRQMPVVKAFVRDPDSPNNRYVQEFYDLLDKARRADASYRRLEGDDSEDYLEKHEAAIGFARGGNLTAQQIGRLRRSNETIAESREYNKEEKRIMIRDNNALIREIAKSVRQTQP